MLKNKANIIIIVLTIMIISIIVAMINLAKDTNKDDVADESNIKSKTLKNVIENKWNSNYDFGTKESTFDEYDIYFDEGIEVKSIDDIIYNIVFTEKYEKNIINNIKSDTSLDSIVDELGQPDFGGKSAQLIGYKYNDFYIFFNGAQASIYRNYEPDIKNKDFFTNSYESAIEFSNELIDSWDDYDTFMQEIDNNSIRYSLINYANKGIRISIIDDKIDVTVYNNCSFKIPENNIYTINTKNKNLIYEVENERQHSIHNAQHIYEQYKLSADNLPPDFEEIGEDEIEFKLIEKDVFIEIQSDISDDGTYNLKFVCINGKYPSFDLKQEVYSYTWVDNLNIAYSVKNKGLYLYNLKTREKTILKEGTEDFYIYGVTKKNKLKVDNFELNV